MGPGRPGVQSIHGEHDPPATAVKRSEALASLSRDHHQALVIAQKLSRATNATAPRAREAFLRYWAGHGKRHFELEEELLFPAYAGHGDPQHPQVLQALGEHAMIRHRAATVAAAPQPRPEALQQLGEELAAHVRLEEREVFPLIEHTLSAPVLSALARAFEDAERDGVGVSR
jgi:hemerythrin-like domain-containing protein